MSNEIRSKIARLIEMDAVPQESSFVASQCLEAIRTGNILGGTTSDMTPEMVMGIYERRKISLDISGKNYFGLNELLQSLPSAKSRVVVFQIESKILNITTVLSHEINFVFGMIAIEQ